MAGDKLIQDIRDTEVQKSKKDIELGKTWNKRIEEYYLKAKKILEDVKKTWDKDLYGKFSREYVELYNSIRNSIETEKKISIEERNKIIREYKEIKKLQSQKSLEIWTKKMFHKTKKILDETKKWIQENLEQAKQYALNLEEKWIWDFISNEWPTLQVLKIKWINTKEIEQRIKSEWYTDKIKLEITYIFKAHKIWDRWLNQLQEKLIDKVLWSWSFEKGFGKWYIVWYNNQKWNYIQTISNFESELKSKKIGEINSLAFAHYISSKKNLSNNEIINIFWVKNLLDLNEIWSEKSKENKIALNILKAKGLDIKINKIKKVGEDLKNKQGIRLLEYIKSLDSEDKIWISIILLQKNYKNIFKEMETYLMTEIKDEKKVKDIINALKTMKNKLHIKAVIKKLKEYKLNLKQTSYLIEQTSDAWLNEEQIKYLEDKQKLEILKKEWWDEEQIEAIKKMVEKSEQKLYQAEIQHEKNKAIIPTLTDEDIKEISEKWNLEEIIDKKRKEDKKFDAQLKQYEEQEKILNLKYEKNTEQKAQTILKESHYTDKTTGAIFTRTWVDWYTFEWKNWESWEKVSIPISTEEALQVVWKKEAQENLIHFYEILVDVNMIRIWQYRKEIFTAIGNNVWWREFISEDNNYLNENEIRVFLKNILYSLRGKLTWEEKNEATSIKWKNITLRNLVEIFKYINKWQAITGQEDVNIKWESRLEKIFMDKFVNTKNKSGDSILWFDNDAFTKAIS